MTTDEMIAENERLAQRAEIPRHPATYSAALYPIFGHLIDKWAPPKKLPLRVLDPFAGVGGIHQVAAHTSRSILTVGVELMPRWAAAHPDTIVGDATRLDRAWTSRFDVVCTSPCYGNRMADHHVNRDDSHRRSYAHYYGVADFHMEADPASNAGAMQWGDEYRELHEQAWSEVCRVLRPGGLFLLNIKDHYRGGARVRVSDWHRRTIQRLGFTRRSTTFVPLTGFGFGANREARVDREWIYVFTKDGDR